MDKVIGLSNHFRSTGNHCPPSPDAGSASGERLFIFTSSRLSQWLLLGIWVCIQNDIHVRLNCTGVKFVHQCIYKYTHRSMIFFFQKWYKFCEPFYGSIAIRRFVGICDNFVAPWSHKYSDFVACLKGHVSILGLWESWYGICKVIFLLQSMS